MRARWSRLTLMPMSPARLCDVSASEIAHDPQQNDTYLVEVSFARRPPFSVV